MEDKRVLIYQLFFIIYFIIHSITTSLIIWCSNFWKILYYINLILFIHVSFYLIIYVHYAFKFKPLFLINHRKCYNNLHYLFNQAQDIIMLLFSFFKIIIFLNERNYQKYIKNCPFTFNIDLLSFNESIYGNRICELYNINTNSRYKYQYICSYNAFEDFKGDKTKDGFDKVTCVPKLTNIIGNDVIRSFTEVYGNKNKNNSNLYYCGRIDEPLKDEYIKDEYCNKENYHNKLINLLSVIFEFLYYLQNKLFRILEKEIVDRNARIQELRRAIESQYKDDDCETEYDDSNENNILFIEEEDRNIILENHTVYNTSSNIKDYIGNKEKLKLD